MSSPKQHTADEIANALSLDLWNDHRYQITSTFRFYTTLHANGHDAGDEPSLSSALVHTRSLLEFYAPRLQRDRQSEQDAIWWANGLINPTDNTAWQKAIAKTWPPLKEWHKPINVFLSHLSWQRRELDLPKDKNGQRWPLLRLTDLSRTMLAHFESLVTDQASSVQVVQAIREIRHETDKLWIDTASATRSEGVAQCCSDDAATVLGQQ